MTPQLDQVFSMPPVTPASEENKIVSPTQAFNTVSSTVLSSEPSSSDNSKDQKFWSFQKEEKKWTWISILSLHIMTAATWWLIMLFLWFLFFFLAKVNIWWSIDDMAHKNSVGVYKDAIMYIDSLLWYPWISQYNAIQQLTSMTEAKDIVASTIPFIFKRDIMVRLIDQLKLTILTKHKESQTLSQEITKYGFISADVMSLMESSKDKIPIMTSLHTLETVKFGTALKLFSMLDTFLQQASQTLWTNKQFLETLITSYLANGEAYISNYLSMCYLNPYERLPDCNQINDFANYFKYENPDTKIDYTVLARLLELVENKLETSSVASIKINFNRFDPNAKNLSFQVTISTLAEDEAAFVAKGILNPHVFILSTLVNLLKQSLFVIGDSINVQNIAVKKQNITIGNVQIPVKTSTMSFDLPLQNSSEREIFDFLDITKY